MQVRRDCTKFHLPHKTSGTTGAHAAKTREELLQLPHLLLLSTRAQQSSKLRALPRAAEPQAAPPQRVPSTEEQSPPHDKPKATEQMQQQSCTDPFCDAPASSINFHLPVQPSLQGKGREQKCPEVLHGASSHQQPATAPPRRLERLRTQVTTLPSASWPCLSVTYSQGILE